MAKKIKNEALAGRFGGQSVCYGVQNCLFHVCQFEVARSSIGFPVTDSGMFLLPISKHVTVNP
ncbi:MAG: hypothetical protein KDE33_12025, partial [Bacteroidetes bacterium]|nr:hypothetical protein [Bacteroidota bacterium]